VERETWSGKARCNTRKALLVADKDGYICYIDHGCGGRTADREMKRRKKDGEMNGMIDFSTTCLSPLTATFSLGLEMKRLRLV
jgi:hypothetical protein